LPLEASKSNYSDQVDLAKPLSKGATVRFLCKYTGALNAQMRGFYRSKCADRSSGEERHCAVTQFAATDARRAFPCWDEPAVKATFVVSVVAPGDRRCTVLSNMPETSEEKDLADAELAPIWSDSDVDVETQRLVRFGESPVMSTYLLAVVVGEFECRESRARDDAVVVRVYTPRGKTEQGQFALDTSVGALEVIQSQWRKRIGKRQSSN
jgi:puromycin-sensitive aminopeptidase